MTLDIKIKKGDEVLYNRSVTSADLPVFVLQLLKTVHGAELSIIRRD